MFYLKLIYPDCYLQKYIRLILIFSQLKGGKQVYNQKLSNKLYKCSKIMLVIPSLKTSSRSLALAARSFTSAGAVELYPTGIRGMSLFNLPSRVLNRVWNELGITPGSSKVPEIGVSLKVSISPWQPVPKACQIQRELKRWIWWNYINTLNLKCTLILSETFIASILFVSKALILGLLTYNPMFCSSNTETPTPFFSKIRRISSNF